MNLGPVIRQLRTEDFYKMLASCKHHRERFYLECARYDHDFEYHIDLPGEEGPKSQAPMDTWLHDEKIFPE